jgi:hypothetical protein
MVADGTPAAARRVWPYEARVLIAGMSGKDLGATADFLFYACWRSDRERMHDVGGAAPPHGKDLGATAGVPSRLFCFTRVGAAAVSPSVRVPFDVT